MSRLSFAFITICLSLTGCFSKPYSMTSIFEKIAQRDESAKTELEKCASDCSKKEKEFATRIQQTFLKAVEAGGSVAPEQGREINGVFRSAFEIYRDQPENLFSAIKVAYMHVRGFFGGDEEFNRFADELIGQAKTFAAENPEFPDAKPLLAEMIVNFKRDFHATLTVTSDCLKNDPHNKICRAIHEKALDEYEKPVCEGSAVKPGLVLSAVSGNKKHDSYEMQTGIKQLFTEKYSPEIDTVVIELNTEGYDKFADYIKRFSGEKLIVEFEGKLIAEFPVNDDMFATYYLSVKVPDKTSSGDFLQSFCKNPAVKKLPEEFKLQSNE